MMYFWFKRNIRVVIVVILREVAFKEVPEASMDAVTNKDMEGGEVDPLISLTMEKYAMFKYFVPNHTLFVGTTVSLSML
jgi:hypothetical protein